MKVLFITDYPAPYRVDLFNLINEKVDLTVAYGSKKDSTREDKYINENIKYKTLWLHGISVGTRSNISFKINKVIKKGDYDLIVVSEYCSPMSLIAMIYLKMHKIPFIYNADGGFINDNESRFMRRNKTNIIKLATAWMTSGEASDKYLEFYGANKDRIYHYPFAFNYKKERYLPTKEEKIELKKELGIKEEKAFLFVGRMIPCKRIDKILKAFSKIGGDVGLYFIGAENLPKEYQNIINELDIRNVHCVGFKQGIELKKYYLASDVFLLPTYHEVWGLVVNEAMTNGCPTITSDTCNAGLGLIKNWDNGIIIKTDSDEELLEAMTKLINDDKLRECIANNSFDTMRNFNIETNADRHIEIFKDFYNKYGKGKQTNN